MDKVIFIISKIIFAICTGLVLVTIVVYSNLPYLCKNHFLPSNFLILLCAIPAFILIATLIYRTRNFRNQLYVKIRNKTDNKHFRIDHAVMILSAIVFALQIFIMYNIYFETGWDVQNTTTASELMAFGKTDGFIEEYYFGMYPNNLFYVFIQAVILKLGSFIGIFAEYKMMYVVIVNCILNTLSCYLVYKVTAIYARKRYALIAFFFAVISFGLSPWSVIPYSDAFGIIFPIASFYLFVKPTKNNKIKYMNFAFATILAIFGYLVKPQCFIIIIALLIFEVIYGFRKIHIKNFIKPIAVILSVCIFVPLISMGVTQVAINNGIEVDEGKEFGVAHYFMMGLNTERQGVWAEEDVEFSKIFTTTEARNSADWERAMNRIDQMQDGEYTELLKKKLLITFNDGTYAWGQEGRFFNEQGMFREPNDTASPYLRSYVYMWEENYETFSYLSHIVWISIFVLAFLVLLFKANDEKGRKEIPILMLAILGLILFELLFEARARYIYTYLPVFCVLAALGFNGVVQKISLYRDHKNKQKEFDFY